MNMNFESELKTALQTERKSPDTNAFISKLQSTHHKLAIKHARIQSSFATSVFLLVFGWVSFSQLNSTVFEETYYIYEDNFEPYADLDSSSFDLYVADMALYLLENEDVWSVLEFFQEKEYETAFNIRQEINL